MREIIAGLIVALVFIGSAYAETVNPASNVTADSANTAGTIVLRSPSTGIASITLQAGAVDTAKIASGVIDTSKINGLGSMPNGAVLCAGPAGKIGYCTATPTNGACALNCTVN